MAKTPVPNYLTKREEQYLLKFAEMGDSRKALKAIFGENTPQRKHDEIMGKPMAVKRYKELIKQIDSDFEMAAANALVRLRTMLSTNINDIIDPRTGTLRPDIPDEYYDILKSIKYDSETGEISQINTIDKLRTIEIAMKHLGLLNKQVDVNVNVSVLQQVNSDEVSDEEVEAFLAQVSEKRESAALPQEIKPEEDAE
ncbi:hypothetical protein [Hydrogenimonas sp.]